MQVTAGWVDLLATDNERVKGQKLYQTKDEMDFFFISYPKSGRTWIYAFLQLYIIHTMGTVKGSYSQFWPEDKGSPKLAFTHRAMEYEPGTPMIYILRDPRDVMVSYYFQAKLRTCSIPEQTEISEFIRDETLGMPKLVEYHAWFYHFFKNARKRMLIRYEGLHLDTLGTWRRLLHFIGVDREDEVLKVVSQTCSFQNMKTLLKHPQSFFRAHPSSWQFMAMENGKVTAKPSDPEAHKVRRGKVGGYVDYLSTDDIDYINKMMKKMPKEWRY